MRSIRRWQLVLVDMASGVVVKAPGRTYIRRKRAQHSANWINERMRRIAAGGNPKGPLPRYRWVIRRWRRDEAGL